MERLVKLAKENSSDFAALNYDLVVEGAVKSSGYTYDYGLERWNSEKIVNFKRSSSSSIRLLKLHGSLNWFQNDDNIDIKNEDDSPWVLPNLVFGGATGKLRVDGPFLQLRHEFQARLLKCSNFIIIGYSFQDEHINSIIRRWTSTRRNAKLIVVDPSSTERFADKIGMPYYKSDARPGESLTVELKHVKAPASESIEILRRILNAPTSPIKKLEDGLLPLLDFEVHES